jgi:hypothetical protein
MYFNGFCVAFPRSGSLTYVIEKCPLNAAGVSCSFSSSREILAFMSVPFAAYVYEKFGLIYFGLFVTPVLLIFWIANVRLTLKNLASFEVIHADDEEVEMKNMKNENDEKRAEKTEQPTKG